MYENIQSQLNELGIIPKKALGQNFLIHLPTIERIIDRVKIESPSHIIEIGPGLGALTKRLREIDPFMEIIELDPDLFEFWKNQGVTSLQADALEIDWEQLNLPIPTMLVSNLPYQIASSLVIERSIAPHGVETMILMFQKEVAQKIMAKMKTKEYGLLSVIAQTFWKIEFILEAGPSDFYPSPKIASRVLIFKRIKNGFNNHESYLNFVKQAFRQKRKKLTNNLQTLSSNIKDLLKDMKISENIRAEELSTAQFVELWKKVCQF